ncbi:MAG: hypothetical protein QN183_13820 [Armatimonadota bacterium]|nr:hypothetical protein [Armatimonadota bacterium]
MATRLFLRDLASPNAPSNGEKSAALPVGTFKGNSGAGYEDRSLNTTAGASGVTKTITTLAQTAHQDLYIARFTSSPLAAQTIQAQTWTLRLSVAESNAAANAYLILSLYAYRPSTGEVVGYIWDSDTTIGSEWPTTETAVSVTFNGAALNVSAQDVLVLEVWAHAVQGMAASYTLTVGLNGADGTLRGSYLECPQNLSFAGAVITGAAQMVGAASVSASGRLVAAGSAAMVGAAGMSAAGGLTIPGQASMLGQAQLSALGGLLIRGQASMVGAAEAVPAGRVVMGGRASWAGQASMSPAARVTAVGRASMVGAAGVSAAGRLTATGRAALAGAADMSALGGMLIKGQASMVGAAEAVPAGRVAFGAQSQMVGATTLSAGARLTIAGALAAVGGAQIVAHGTVTGPGGGATNGSRRRQSMPVLMRRLRRGRR